MSIQLVVEMLDHAPAELTPAERLLLVAIAEKANEQTRESWPGMDTLTQRTGLCDRQIRRLLADLAARGYEVRVQCGVDKRGMPVFATKGHQTVYRVPNFRQRGTHTSALKGDARVRLNEPKADISGTQRRTPTSAKADAHVRPSPQVPSEQSLNQRARAGDDEIVAVIGALRDRTGKIIDEHHATKVIKQLEKASKDPIRHRINCFTGAIAKDPNPDRFLPTRTPPPVKDVLATLIEGNSSA